MKRALILGGTGDAVALAAQAAQIPDLEVITSLAGRTQHPTPPIGTVRVGGFGGAAGLADYLRDRQIHALIDATHPFSAQISWNAAAAAAAAAVPHLMLIRPAWEKHPHDRWIEVATHEAAAAALPTLAQRIFLTIGRQELAAFAHLDQLWFLMRMIDPPAANTIVPNGLLLLERGPFALSQERSLMLNHDIGAIVSKNSGGDATYAKIIAARELNLPVVMVQRSPTPIGTQAANATEALSWLRSTLQV